MKKKFTTYILVLVLLVGVCLLLYPTVSDYWNSIHQTRAIAGYMESVSDLNNDDYAKIMAEAEEFNQYITDVQLSNGGIHGLAETRRQRYDEMLNIDDSGIMGYIEIPEIDITLPIYHGIDEKVLQVGVGHLPGSSLPIGGESTHCILSGHRGLPSARLFTDLEKLVVGDRFYIHTLDELYTYEVDQIHIVLPDAIHEMDIVEGEDYCTLLTCTPYGVNTHRLLVRGHRVPNEEDGAFRVPADAMQISPYLMAPIIAVPIFVLIVIYWVLTGKKRSSKSSTKKEKKTLLKDDEK